MENEKSFENFPSWIVMASVLFSLAVYAFGFLILFRLGLVFSLLYLLYVFILEYRLIKNHCTNCFYWGKACGFGKGRLSSWFFKKGEISEFYTCDMTWKDMIPDMLVSFIPLIAGVVLLILKFEIILLVYVLLLLIFTTAGNGFIRGSLTCRYCKQRELGCPADKLFNK